jgi:hypothetical protein
MGTLKIDKLSAVKAVDNCPLFSIPINVTKIENKSRSKKNPTVLMAPIIARIQIN